MSVPRSVLDIRAGLGESPIWDGREGALYWIDGRKPNINRFDPATARNHAVTSAEPVHAIALTRGHRLLCAFEASLGLIDCETGALQALVSLIEGVEDNLNDGACDRAGRFWVGSKARDWVKPVGVLFRYDPDGSVHRLDQGFQLSNGLGWSPDNRTMYFIDSAPREIYAYDFDLAGGGIKNRRRLVRIAEEHGLPDGMTVDAEGSLWVAQWSGGRVVRYDPDGKIERVIPMPVQRPTSVAFGGRDLTTLFITSGTMRMSEAELAAEPLAGNLFALETDVQGLPEPRFAGA
ncbi:MAG TPA: SMP-30/gluconolactonase/LRE family protein [Stellaceae bacterium]|nr:SMP-30/gluconolactonase/LRE family protein [Stellaceae bacterium]